LDTELAAIYDRVATKWGEHEADLLGGRCGYSIFGSKPYSDPPLMIIGLNPGFGGDAEDGPYTQSIPPEDSYLGNDPHRFKTELQAIFDFDGGERMLDGAVSTNFLFFRSVSMDDRSELSWGNVREGLRKHLEKFCLDELQNIVRMLRPKCILVVGLDAVNRYVSDPYVRLYRAESQFHRLIVTGSLGGTECIGIPHLTGSRFKAFDKELMSIWLKQYFTLNAGRS